MGVFIFSILLFIGLRSAGFDGSWWWILIPLGLSVDSVVCDTGINDPTKGGDL